MKIALGLKMMLEGHGKKPGFRYKESLLEEIGLALQVMYRLKYLTLPETKSKVYVLTGKF